MWFGCFEEFPDYPTQGESLGELEEKLGDLYRDLASGEIPGIRRIAELTVDGLPRLALALAKISSSGLNRPASKSALASSSRKVAGPPGAKSRSISASH
jgi:hypothetical protein